MVRCLCSGSLSMCCAPLDMFLRVTYLVHVIILFLVFSGISILFPRDCTDFCSHQWCVSFLFPAILAGIHCSLFLFCVRWGGILMELWLTVSWWLRMLNMFSDIYILAIWISSFGNWDTRYPCQNGWPNKFMFEDKVMIETIECITEDNYSKLRLIRKWIL